MKDQFENFINLFFIPDQIHPEIFFNNYVYLEANISNYTESMDFGTESIKTIKYIPPVFDKFFICAYPDVYKWYQNNIFNKNIIIENELAKLSENDQNEYFEDPNNVLDFYISLIKQFKNEHIYKLECAIN